LGRLALTVIREDRKRAQAAPWLALGFYGYCFCLVTTYGRLRSGYNLFFLASRYTTHATLILIALLALIAIIHNSDSDRQTNPWWVRMNTLGNSGAIASILILLFFGDLMIFHKSAIESRSKRFGKELVPFFGYFDPIVDGARAGPFFPLCPLPGIGIFDIGLAPLCEQSHFHPIKNAKFIDHDSGVTGTFRVSQQTEVYTAFDSVSDAWVLTGSVLLSQEAKTNKIFVKMAGAAGFIAATALEPGPGMTQGEYVWRLFVPQAILRDREIPIECWVYDKRYNIFKKVDQAEG
jgi:hypothetical protein